MVFCNYICSGSGSVYSLHFALDSFDTYFISKSTVFLRSERSYLLAHIFIKHHHVYILLNLKWMFLKDILIVLSKQHKLILTKTLAVVLVILNEKCRTCCSTSPFKLWKTILIIRNRCLKLIKNRMLCAQADSCCLSLLFLK